MSQPHMGMSQTPSGPPYAPRIAAVGGRPAVHVDDPPTAVFLCLYAAFAATNMTIFQLNRRRGHKFIPSAALFGFCMSRIVTCSLRLAWASHPTNVRLAIAAQIFVSAGILIVYVINIIMAQRILRAMRPQLGWNKPLRLLIKVLYAVIAASLIMTITVTVINVYTLNPHTHQIVRDVQLVSTTYLFFVTCLPLVILALAHLTPASFAGHPKESFGAGSMLSKHLVLLWSTCLCMTAAGFKLGTLWMPPRPVTDPAWYHSKAAFYVFNFTLEILILLVLTSFRLDRRFHVPDGSKGPGDYSRAVTVRKEPMGQVGAGHSLDQSSVESLTYSNHAHTEVLTQKKT